MRTRLTLNLFVIINTGITIAGSVTVPPTSSLPSNTGTTDVGTTSDKGITTDASTTADKSTIDDITTDLSSSTINTINNDTSTMSYSAITNVATNLVTTDGVINSTSTNAVTNAIRTDTITDSFNTDTFTDSVTTQAITDLVTTDAFTDSVTTNPITDLVTTDAFTDSVTTNAVTDLVTTDTVTESITTDGVTDSVTTNAVTDSVTTNAVTDSVTDSVTTNTVTDSVTTDVVSTNITDASSTTVNHTRDTTSVRTTDAGVSLSTRQSTAIVTSTTDPGPGSTKRLLDSEIAIIASITMSGLVFLICLGAICAWFITNPKIHKGRGRHRLYDKEAFYDTNKKAYISPEMATFYDRRPPPVDPYRRLPYDPYSSYINEDVPKHYSNQGTRLGSWPYFSSIGVRNSYCRPADWNSMPNNDELALPRSWVRF